MKFIDLAQNTPEWLEFRRDKIGASDAPIILGVSPFQTPYQLYLNKVEHMEKKQNRAMKRGHKLEAEARKSFEEMYMMLYMDQVTVVPYVVQSDAYSWMIASLDGLDLEKNVLVEIKCPGPKDHQIALDGKIPDHYIPQLQHQLFVTGFDKMYYFSYRKEDSHPVLLEYVQEKDACIKLIDAESKFFNCMLNKNPLELVAMQFAVMKQELEAKAAEEQTLKEKLVELSTKKLQRRKS